MEKRFCSLFSIVLITFLLILVNCVVVSAITGSMGNARMILYPEVNGWTYTTIEKSILVKNVNDVPINITLVTDEEGGKFLELIDKEFVLQPHTEKKAEFLVKVKKEGTYEGKINVFFSSVDPENKEPNVVLSSTIIAIAKKAGEYDDTGSDGCDGNCDLNDTDGGISVGTGGVVGVGGDKKPIGAILLGISSLILLIILIALIFIMVKKKSVKKGEKRGGRLNAGKKK